ncbi:MAG: undecaprenyl-diphosphate phosphatase [Clostridia bacterium]|nr:undecaprenyl-diphosphate phosphatase [Clostridia bacterium]
MLSEVLKSVFLGIIEGVTEWLPVSSTGHMLLVDEFLTLDASDEFKRMFFIVIQLGAILAVTVLYFRRMLPIEFNSGLRIKKQTVSVWLKVAVACVPGAVVTLTAGDFVDSYLHTPQVIAFALIFYGLVFIFVESRLRGKTLRVETLEEISFRDAFIIGLFQVLSIIPGTSRSGATVIGALLIGVPRVAAAEFTFFMAVPVMLGMSLIEVIRFGFNVTAGEAAILVSGAATAFAVSLITVRWLIKYVSKKSFTVFGYYRILLGAAVLIYFGADIII